MNTTYFNVKDENGVIHPAVRVASYIRTGTLNDPRAMEEGMPSYRLRDGERLNTKGGNKFVGVISGKEYTIEQ